MTFIIDQNVIRTILRINVGWMIWAGSLAAQHLVVMITCEPRPMPAGPHPWISAIGLVATACGFALLYRIVSNARVHRAALAPRSDLGVDYLAATVAALSLLGIVWTTILNSASSVCAP